MPIVIGRKNRRLSRGGLTLIDGIVLQPIIPGLFAVSYGGHSGFDSFHEGWHRDRLYEVAAYYRSTIPMLGGKIRHVCGLYSGA
jgi:hypothetical protein